MLLPRALAPTAAAASLLLLLARDADQRGAHAATAAAFLEWAAPTFALLSASAIVGLQQRANPDGLRVYPPAGQPLTPARAALRDAESLALSVPACVLGNGIVLAAIQLGGSTSWSLPEHSHVLCWALDWLGVAPALLLGRAALASDGYRFDDPADWRSAREWSTTGELLFSQPSSIGAGCLVQVRGHSAGWRTLRFVLPGGGGSVQSVHRLAGAGTRDEQAIANEYLKTMAAATLLAFRRRRQAAATDATAAGGGSPPPPRLLLLGLGGGSLVSLFGCLYPGAEIVAVELDQVNQKKGWTGEKEQKKQPGPGAVVHAS